MKLYGQTFKASKMVDSRVRECVQNELLKVVNKYKANCKEGQIVDIGSGQDFLVICSDVVTFDQILQEVKEVLQENNANYAINISATEKIPFLIRNKGTEDEEDAFDYVNNMLNINNGLYKDAYLANKISYVYFVNKLMYSVTMSVSEYDKISLGISVELKSNDENNEIQKIVSYIEREWTEIVNAIKVYN